MILLKYFCFRGFPQFIDIVSTGWWQIFVDNFVFGSESTWIKKNYAFNWLFYLVFCLSLSVNLFVVGVDKFGFKR